jgi:hypothetical protein
MVRSIPAGMEGTVMGKVIPFVRRPTKANAKALAGVLVKALRRHRPASDKGPIQTLTPRAHLLSELVAHLDTAEKALHAANDRLAAIETEFNRMVFHDADIARARKALSDLSARRERLERRLRIETLLDESRAAEERFRRVSDLFAIAGRYAQVPVVAANLRMRLAEANPVLRYREDVRAAARDLADALHDYCWNQPSDAADRKVRAAWSRLEHSLAA